MRPALIAITILALTACSSDDPEPDAGPLKCDALYGQPTPDALEAMDQGCADTDGELIIYGNAFDECDDGTTVYWNDHGWGYSDGDWQEHEGPELVPPTLDTC